MHYYFHVHMFYELHKKPPFILLEILSTKIQSKGKNLKYKNKN